MIGREPSARPTTPPWSSGQRPRAIRAFSRLLAWTNRTFARPPDGCVIQMEAEGVRGGAPAALAVRLFHPERLLADMEAMGVRVEIDDSKLARG